MFYLKGRRNGETKHNNGANEEDDFGWWLSNPESPESLISTGSNDRLSIDSSSSMLSCIDSDAENLALSNEFSRQEFAEVSADMELRSWNRENIDARLVENCSETNDVPAAAQNEEELIGETDSGTEKFEAICYTPERLVRSQEYRILTPSPRYLTISQGRISAGWENPRKARRCRRRLNHLMDTKQAGTTQVKALLDGTTNEILEPMISSREKQIEDSSMRIKDTSKDPIVADRRQSIRLQTSSDTIDGRSSCDRLNLSWEDCKKLTTLASSVEDTSGIQSNDWSSDTHSDARTTSLCLYDELAIASRDSTLDLTQGRIMSLNGTVSFFEVVSNGSGRIFVEEDRFCSSTHDQLTRLALAIETDASVPTGPDDPENLVQHLRRKVERLQDSSKDIYRDICNLRKSFQCDEKRMADLSSDAIKLREDVHEMRYLDDLLNLLRGELERISKRNWPFVLGHTESETEEMNLIV